MLPEKLDFLERFDSFYQVMVNSAKEDKINEKDFYLIIRAKAKSMDRERMLRLSKKTIVKIIGAKKGSDIKY